MAIKPEIVTFRGGTEASFNGGKLLPKEPFITTDSGKLIYSYAPGLTKTCATTDQLQAVASGAPKGIYTTLSALQTAFPTGDTNIYLVLADGKWYYWNEPSSTWLPGGVYQAQSFVASGMSITDTGNYYTGTNVEDALQEVGANLATGDRSNNTVAFTEATVDADIASGENNKTLWGKVKKRFGVISTLFTAIKAITAPEYSASSTYEVGDYRTYSNVLYKCSTKITVAEAWTTSHWTATKVATELVTINNSLANKNSLDWANLVDLSALSSYTPTKDGVLFCSVNFAASNTGFLKVAIGTYIDMYAQHSNTAFSTWGNLTLPVTKGVALTFTDTGLVAKVVKFVPYK